MVVFGVFVVFGWGICFYLVCVEGNGEICYCCIFCFFVFVGDYNFVVCFEGCVGGIYGFVEGFNLVDFEEECVCSFYFNIFFYFFWVGDEEVVVDDLYFVIEFFGYYDEVFLVFFVEWVFDGDYWVGCDEFVVEFKEFVFVVFFVSNYVFVFFVVEEFVGSGVEGEGYFVVWFVVGFFDGFDENIEWFSYFFYWWGEVIFVVDVYGVFFVFFYDDFFEDMIGFGYLFYSFVEVVSFNGYDYEFLEVEFVVCVNVVVDDVVYWNWYDVGVGFVYVLVEW